MRFPLLISLLVVISTSVATTNDNCTGPRFYTFAWSLTEGCKAPRGGTSTGAALTLDTTPHPGWLSLQEQGLSQFEKDRRAILAMAGGYRTTFDFLEVVGYTPEFERDPPYRSWGTEYIYVVADEKTFISLQHIMVMQYVDKNGNVSEPMVQKHWRQDWRYEDRELLEYAGNDVRKRRKLSRTEAKGTWSQSVFQVDDSPRYESFGKWVHQDNFSTWKSAETWRPVPRRESSFRKDYQVLIGFNRHTITPTGWLQEEENLKAVLDEQGGLQPGTAYLSKELGVARYEKLKDFDFSAGDEYWQRTEKFWYDVRMAWTELERNNKTFVLHRVVDGMPLFMALFSEAEKVFQNAEYNSEATKPVIDRILKDYTSVPK